MSGETAVQELERLRGELKTKTDECAALTQKLSHTQSALTAANTSVESLTGQVADLGTKLKDAEGKVTAAEAASKADKERADKAEKKLAMSPEHIDVSGRKTASADGTTSGDQGANVLEQFSAMPERTRAEGKAKRDFYIKNKAEIIRLKNLSKEK